MHFSSANVGFAVGRHRVVVRTLNGGTTWTASTPGAGDFLLGLAFRDADHGVAVGDDGALYETSNRGDTWTSRPTGLTEWIYSVTYVKP